jgi:hypothetical protein
MQGADALMTKLPTPSTKQGADALITKLPMPSTVMHSDQLVESQYCHCCHTASMLHFNHNCELSNNPVINASAPCF